jgi:hypothetical protein
MGRPSFKPTPAQRKTVFMMAEIGMSDESIAHYVGLRTVKSLYKHFGREIRKGRNEAIVLVARACLGMVDSNPVVAEFYVNTVGSARFPERDRPLKGVRWRTILDHAPDKSEPNYEKYKRKANGEYVYERLELLTIQGVNEQKTGPRKAEEGRYDAQQEA